jgi:AraC-like DNA-binding protein
MTNLGASSFISVGRHVQPGRWHMRPHAHPAHEMIVVIRGRQAALVRGQRLEAGPGDVLLYPPAVAHEEWQEGEEALETVFITFRWTEAPAGVPLRVEDAQGRIRVLASWLFDERHHRGPLTETVSRALFDTILAEYARLWRQGTDNPFTALRRHTEQHLARRITLGELAAQAGLSRYHFIRAYRKSTGRTPMADVRHIRLDRARDLILTTSLPLKEVARRVGLGDVYHMTRLFRRQLGVTPGSLRRHATSPARSRGHPG